VVHQKSSDAIVGRLSVLCSRLHVVCLRPANVLSVAKFERYFFRLFMIRLSDLIISPFLLFRFWQPNISRPLSCLLCCLLLSSLATVYACATGGAKVQAGQTEVLNGVPRERRQACMQV
jgi:hypothetical protein